jgi:uncharacterized damage-inducible protein DinB
VKTNLTVIAVFTLCSLVSSSSVLMAQPVPPAVDAPVRLAGAQASPSQVYGKLYTGQEGEVVAAAEAMPADKYNFAPTAGTFQGVRTFAQQVTHIASSQYYYFTGFGVKPGGNPDAIDKLTNKDEVVKALKDSYAFAHQVIDTMTVENAFEQTGKDKSTRAGSAARGLAHNTDHYGQMVEYLRMNGIVPPASRN